MTTAVREMPIGHPPGGPTARPPSDSALGDPHPRALGRLEAGEVTAARMGGARRLLVLCRVGLAALLGLGVGSGTAGQGDGGQANRMLSEMNQAMQSLDYEGTLVHLQENRLETLHLVHRVAGGRVQERLVSLSGPVRAVARERDRVTCVMPDGRPISVRSHRGRNPLRPSQIHPELIADHYQLAIEGAARVAGRDTDVLAIKPRDALRYGYRLHLDQASRLPLKSDLIDQAGEPIEQLMFTSLLLGPGQAGPQSVPRPEAEPTAEGGGVSRAGSDWRFDSRPAGFELILHDLLSGPGGSEVEHFVFSDQLSAYSIYIEGDAPDGLDGVTRFGAIHAAGRRVKGHQITAVGEVPSATVEVALAGVSLGEEGGP